MLGDERLGSQRELHGRLGIAAHPGGIGRPRERLRQARFASRPCIDCLPERGGGLGERECSRGFVGGFEVRGPGSPVVARGRPMPCPLAGHARRRHPVERVGRPTMEPAGSRPGQGPGDDLADDRMPDVEPVPGRRRHATPDRVAQGRADGLVVETRHGTDESLIGGPPDDREGLDRGACRGRESADPAEHERTKGGRAWTATRPAAHPDIVGTQQLLDEHRVAGRTLEQAVHQRGLRPLPEQGGDLVGDLGPVEPLHLDPIEPPAVRDRQRADQVGLVVAGRGDDDQRNLAGSA